MRDRAPRPKLPLHGCYVSVTIQKCTEAPHAGKSGRHFHLGLQYKCAAERRPFFAACGTPDRAIGLGLVLSTEGSVPVIYTPLSPTLHPELTCACEGHAWRAQEYN
jgi:hypothetical protein